MNKKPTFDQAITLYEMGVKSSPVPMQCQFPGAYVRTISQGVGLSLWWYLYTYKKCASLTVQPQLYTFMLLTFCSSYLYNFTGVCHILATYIVRVIQLFLCACHTCNSHDSVRISFSHIVVSYLATRAYTHVLTLHGACHIWLLIYLAANIVRVIFTYIVRVIFSYMFGVC